MTMLPSYLSLTMTSTNYTPLIGGFSCFRFNALVSLCNNILEMIYSPERIDEMKLKITPLNREPSSDLISTRLHHSFKIIVIHDPVDPDSYQTFEIQGYYLGHERYIGLGELESLLNHIDPHDGTWWYEDTQTTELRWRAKYGKTNTPLGIEISGEIDKLTSHAKRWGIILNREIQQKIDDLYQDLKILNSIPQEAIGSV